MQAFVIFVLATLFDCHADADLIQNIRLEDAESPFSDTLSTGNTIEKHSFSSTSFDRPQFTYHRKRLRIAQDEKSTVDSARRDRGDSTITPSTHSGLTGHLEAPLLLLTLAQKSTGHHLSKSSHSSLSSSSNDLSNHPRTSGEKSDNLNPLPTNKTGSQVSLKHDHSSQRVSVNTKQQKQSLSFGNLQFQRAISKPTIHFNPNFSDIARRHDSFNQQTISKPKPSHDYLPPSTSTNFAEALKNDAESKAELNSIDRSAPAAEDQLATSKIAVAETVDDLPEYNVTSNERLDSVSSPHGYSTYSGYNEQDLALHSKRTQPKNDRASDNNQPGTKSKLTDQFLPDDTDGISSYESYEKSGYNEDSDPDSSGLLGFTTRKLPNVEAGLERSRNINDLTQKISHKSIKSKKITFSEYSSEGSHARKPHQSTYFQPTVNLNQSNTSFTSSADDKLPQSKPSAQNKPYSTTSRSEVLSYSQYISQLEQSDLPDSVKKFIHSDLNENHEIVPRKPLIKIKKVSTNDSQRTAGAKVVRLRLNQKKITNNNSDQRNQYSTGKSTTDHERRRRQIPVVQQSPIYIGADLGATRPITSYYRPSFVQMPPSEFEVNNNQDSLVRGSVVVPNGVVSNSDNSLFSDSVQQLVNSEHFPPIWYKNSVNIKPTVAANNHMIHNHNLFNVPSQYPLVSSLTYSHIAEKPAQQYPTGSSSRIQQSGIQGKQRSQANYFVHQDYVPFQSTGAPYINRSPVAPSVYKDHRMLTNPTHLNSPAFSKNSFSQTTPENTYQLTAPLYGGNQKPISLSPLPQINFQSYLTERGNRLLTQNRPILNAPRVIVSQTQVPQHVASTELRTILAAPSVESPFHVSNEEYHKSEAASKEPTDSQTLGSSFPCLLIPTSVKTNNNLPNASQNVKFSVQCFSSGKNPPNIFSNTKTDTMPSSFKSPEVSVKTSNDKDDDKAVILPIKVPSYNVRSLKSLPLATQHQAKGNNAKTKEVKLSHRPISNFVRRPKRMPELRMRPPRHPRFWRPNQTAKQSSVLQRPTSLWKPKPTLRPQPFLLPRGRILPPTMSHTRSAGREGRRRPKHGKPQLAIATPSPTGSHFRKTTPAPRPMFNFRLFG